MATHFRIAKVDRFPGQVISLAHIANANKIVKEKLMPMQLAMFRRTVFGRFVDVDMVFNNPIVHHMLLREVKRTKSDLMSFSVCGKVVTFSKDDFFVMTGLWQSPSRVDRNQQSSYELAINLVYYTKVAMMGKNKQKNPVDLKRFKDVQNLEYYNSLDWGTIIWERTLDALKTTLNDKSSLYKIKVKIKVKEGTVMSDAEREFRDTQWNDDLYLS
ncbi:uncharacterized protein LOC120084700 [Benincasa hispida]|uniref:uncharacterized protein LOC120084700 n=1 Tax=Benincasa hispida TaxID=102211 RepID=UPI0019009DCF|nr:uncharacterized protein LOC120084700 [Benincasa hispida]